MAYEVAVWAADGPNGEYELRRIRVARVEDIEGIVKAWSRASVCVRITRERSENPAYPVKLLWIRPGYKDPFLVGNMTGRAIERERNERFAREAEARRETEASAPVTVPVFDDPPIARSVPIFDDPPKSGGGGDYGGGGASGSWSDSSSSSSDSGSSGGSSGD